MNYYYKGATELDIVAGADVSAGTIHQAAGKAGILSNDAANGETVSITISGQVRMDTAAAFTDGAVVGYDEATNTAVAGGAGDFDMGVAVGTTTAGQTVIVLLNG
jgi:predicted RecA/RadA family phage recombinase